jgi:hypothetical protein
LSINCGVLRMLSYMGVICCALCTASSAVNSSVFSGYSAGRLYCFVGSKDR